MANVYQMVTERIVAQLQKGIIPWRRPWHGFDNASPETAAVSYDSGRAYSFLNQLLLPGPGEYLTFGQIQKAGGRIRKGERSGIVVFYQPVQIKEETKENGETVLKIRTVPVLKYYNVWNLNQCEGIESRWAGRTVEPKVKPDERAEEIVGLYMNSDNHPTLTVARSDRAFYRPSTDEVVVPAMQQYDEVAEYYSTLFHELTHSTGHATRCNRKGVAGMLNNGKEEYSKEELVAEMGAAMLVSFAGLDCEKAFKNSVAYIQGWLRPLQSDQKMVVWAAAQAEKAVKYIFGGNEKC